MVRWRVVLDTNVLVAALRSRQGASAAVLRLAGTSAYEHVLSVALILEYEAVCKRLGTGLHVPHAVVDDILDYLAGMARRQPIHFLWRPVLPDPTDDHILDLAVAAGGASIITHNRRHFVGAERFGIAVLTPGVLLRRLPPEKSP